MSAFRVMADGFPLVAKRRGFPFISNRRAKQSQGLEGGGKADCTVKN
jgi:hypothetical protein